MNASQPCGAGARVIASPIAQTLSGALLQITHHQKVVAERSQRPHGGRDLKPGAFSGGEPALGNHAVGHINEAKPDNRFRGACRPGGNHGIEQRERQRRAQAAQQGAAIQSLVGIDHHGYLVLLIWNWGLSTIAFTNAAIVTFSFWASRTTLRKAGWSEGSRPRPSE